MARPPPPTSPVSLPSSSSPPSTTASQPSTSPPPIAYLVGDIAAFAARQQGTCTSSRVSSLFDAEQTCHGFPLQKTALSGKEVPASSKAALEVLLFTWRLAADAWIVFGSCYLGGRIGCRKIHPGSGGRSCRYASSGVVDKHNPYLELTLGPQKKIASVVKHLNTKWGASNTAPGELMLFPFSAQVGNLSAYKRWILMDSNTTAADVYAPVGNPSVFRLRYGLFPNSEQNVREVPLIPLDTEDNLLTGEREHPYGEPIKGHGLVPIDSINHGARELTMLDRVTETAVFVADSL